MTVLVIVLVAVAVGGLLVLLGPSDRDPLVLGDHWMLRRTPGPLRSVIGRLDRRMVGGAAVVAGFLVVLAVAALVGGLLDWVDEGSFQEWDESIAEWSSTHATDATTTVIDTVTDLGDTVYLLIAMTVLGGYVAVRRRNWGPIAYLGVVGGGVSLLNNGLKHMIDRERPTIGPLSEFAGSSFPSGHSAAAAACWAAMAVVVATLVSRRSVHRTLAVAAVAIAVAVATSRVLLSVHWVSDAIAGLLVGWCWWFVVTLAFGGRWLQLGRPAAEITGQRADLDREPAPPTDATTR